MTASRLLATLLAALACTATADLRAHSELPTQHWCENGRQVEVATFDIPPPSLVQVAVEGECVPGNNGQIPKDCGQFDDDYAIAKSAANAMCAAYQPRKQPPNDYGTVIFLIETPEYTAEDHHDIYSIDHGLKGSCVRCLAPLPPPTQPAPQPFVGS